MAEKEYIEREALVKRLKKEECDCEWLWAILDIPTADVAEVVRCKDCEYYPFCFRTIRTDGNRPDDFCSFGRRKELDNAKLH